jgi:hypothetical protein
MKGRVAGFWPFVQGKDGMSDIGVAFFVLVFAFGPVEFITRL